MLKKVKHANFGVTLLAPRFLLGVAVKSMEQLTKGPLTYWKIKKIVSADFEKIAFENTPNSP